MKSIIVFNLCLPDDVQTFFYFTIQLYGAGIQTQPPFITDYPKHT